ncbi:acetyl CoA synthetase, partial [archaeon]
MFNDLSKLFNPSSIAIVGASRTPGKIGHEILKNLINGGYRGRIYPVNPKANEILGLKCYPSISSIDNSIDVAVICIPATLVPSVVEECGRKGVKFAIIISSGFSETGNRELEDKVVKIARKYGVRIIGPNCAGIICSRSNLYATFEPIVKRGNVAFISQSGALGGAILYQLIDEDKGLDIFVSIGNRADLMETEIMEYLGKDPEVKAILIYIEGLREGEGRAFMKAAMKIVPKKPVIVLKAGTSKAGMRAVQSHTGSIAGSDLIYTYAFKQAGVIKVDSVTDALDAL